MRTMKFKRILNWGISLSLLMTVATACSNDNDDLNPAPNPEEPGSTVNGEMKSYELCGVVTDTDGNPLMGVTVSSGTNVTTTSNAGFFSLSEIDVVNDRSVVKFTKDGYFDVVRSVKASDGSWNVVMNQMGNTEISTAADYSSEETKVLAVGDMKIEMPSDGYMTDSNGKPYNGTVKADMLYLDPNNENFSELMPGGDMAAVRTDGSSALLVSYGMTSVKLTDAEGNKLQLKDGSKATMTFPVPEGMGDNLPSQIPLWSFNESTGLWEEEGMAVLQNGVYIGEVSHFSWTNLDYPEEQATVKGKATDSNGRPIANLLVHVGQIPVRTDIYGRYEQEVPADEVFELTVKPRYYGYYRNVYAVPVGPLEKGETREVNIVLPILPHVYGTIVNEAEGGTNIAAVWIEYSNGRSSNVVTSGTDGKFSIFAPESYRGAAVLKVELGSGEIITKDINLTGNDINVGIISVSSTVNNGGIITVNLSNGQTAQLQIPASNPEKGSGIIVMDDNLLYIDDQNEENVFGIQIEGFKFDKTDYDNAQIYFDSGYGEQMAGQNVNAKVSHINSKFIFDFTGKCQYLNEDTDVYEESASFSANGIALDIFAIMKTMRNVTPSDAGLPSFTPSLSTPAPLAMIVTESPVYGKGGTLYYNGAKSDFDKLKSAADRSGINLIGDDSEDGYYDYVYFSSGKLIEVTYNPEGKKIDDNFDIEDDEAQITVAAFEGVNDSFLNYVTRFNSIRKRLPVRK